VLFYLIPLLGSLGALASLMGVDPAEWFRRPSLAEAQR
jgi:hypothetical protein